MNHMKETIIPIFLALIIVGCAFIIDKRLSKTEDAIILMEERLKRVESTLFMQKVMLEEVYERLTRPF